MSVLFLLIMMAAAARPYCADAQVPPSGIFRQEGIASWYGPEFDGRPTASGEIFNSALYTAAHPTLPFGTILIVTNQHNNRQVTVKVNDRGPFVAARIIDVSRAAAEQLDMLITGTAPVLIESVERIVSPGSPWNSPEAQNRTIPPLQEQPSAPEAASGTVPPPESAPAPVQPPVSGVKLNPRIVPVPDKVYKLQVGSYKVARNAVDTYEKLMNAGLKPSYERSGEYFRVVLAGIPGTAVQSVTEKLAAAGFREVVIREEG
jgi:rare lipoprotein A